MPVPADKQTRSRYPLESFDPRFKNLWLKAVFEIVTIEFPSIKEAQTFQARLHMYRSKLRQSGDPLAKELYRAKTSRKDNTLKIQPTDEKYNSILSEFPLEVATPPQEALPPGAKLRFTEVTPAASPEEIDLFSEFDLSGISEKEI